MLPHPGVRCRPGPAAMAPSGHRCWRMETGWAGHGPMAAAICACPLLVSICGPWIFSPGVLCGFVFVVAGFVVDVVVGYLRGCLAVVGVVFVRRHCHVQGGCIHDAAVPGDWLLA